MATPPTIPPHSGGPALSGSSAASPLFFSLVRVPSPLKAKSSSELVKHIHPACAVVKLPGVSDLCLHPGGLAAPLDFSFFFLLEFACQTDFTLLGHAAAHLTAKISNITVAVVV